MWGPYTESHLSWKLPWPIVTRPLCPNYAFSKQCLPQERDPGLLHHSSLLLEAAALVGTIEQCLEVPHLHWALGYTEELQLNIPDDNPQNVLIQCLQSHWQLTEITSTVGQSEIQKAPKMMLNRPLPIRSQRVLPQWAWDLVFLWSLFLFPFHCNPQDIFTYLFLEKVGQPTSSNFLLGETRG